MIVHVQACRAASVESSCTGTVRLFSSSCCTTRIRSGINPDRTSGISDVSSDSGPVVSSRAVSSNPHGQSAFPRSPLRRQGGSNTAMSCEPRAISAMMSFVCTPSFCSAASRYTSRNLRSGVMLPGIDSVAKEAGKNYQEGASQLELPGPLHGDQRHHSQPLFRCAKPNQALDEKSPP